MKLHRFPLITAMALGLTLVGLARAGNGAPQDSNVVVGAGKRPAIAAYQGNLYLVYTATAPGSKISDVYFTTSTDGGHTWAAGTDLSHNPGESSDPTIAIESTGAIDVAWQDSSGQADNPDIYFIRSTDGGSKWTDSLNVSKTPGASSEPALAVGPDDHVHLVWTQVRKGFTPDAVYSSSQDHGKTWSSYNNVSQTKGVSGQPAVAVGKDGAVHIVWADTTSGDASPDIYYARLRNEKWTKAVDISQTPGRSSLPSLAVSSDGTVQVVWVDSSEGESSPDIFLATSPSNGDGKFSFPQNISNTPGVSTEPAVAVNGAKVAIAWRDTSAGAAHPDVWLATSIDNGHTFSNSMNLSMSPGISYLPNVAFLKERAVCSWEESLAGQAKILVTGRTVQ